MQNLSSTSFKNACKLSLVLLICTSFVLQTNITKPLAETLTSLDSLSSLTDTLEEADGSLETPGDPDQVIIPGNPEAASEDLSQSTNSENVPSPEMTQPDALGVPYAWDPNTNVLTIQGDCKASDIKNEIASEASSAQEVCFSGDITITTDQSTSSPFSGATDLARITALGDTHVSFAAAVGATNPTLITFFNDCANLVSIDGLASWDVSNVSGINCMSYMFQNCTSLASLDALASWDVSNVTGQACMSYMFRSCTGLTSLDGLASWDVSNVTGKSCMSYMFEGCTSLTSLDGLAFWDVSNVTGESCMYYMFRGCTSLTSLDGLASWDVSNVSGNYCMYYMFRECRFLTSLAGLASWDVSNVTGQYCMGNMFYGCSNLTSLDALARWDVSNVTGRYCMSNMFQDCSKLTSLAGLASWDVSNVSGNYCMYSMFRGCTSLLSLDGLASWDVSDVTGQYCMASMFYGCSGLTSLDALAGWNVSNVSEENCMGNMFYGCSNLTSLDALAGWDVSNVSGNYCMYAMFQGCSSLASLSGLASWDVSNVSGNYCMYSMFQGCTSLTSLDGLASWNVSNVTGDSCMYQMFYGCANLQNITGIASWNLANAKASYAGVKNMFKSCPNITFIKGAATDTEGFVPESDMEIPTLVSSNNFYSETAPTTPVLGDTLLANWPTYASQGTWTWKQTVTFDANGGVGAPSSELFAHYSYVIQPAPEQNPTRAGFYFAGWTTDAAGSTRFDFAHTKLASDITLYAQWSANPVFTVVFDTAGGSLEDTQYVIQGQTATRPTTDPTRADYTFVNWYTDATGTALFDFATPISANTVVYAKWETDTPTASFDLNGGEGIPPAAITLRLGEVFPTDKKPADPTRTGYSFEGWYTEATEGSKVEWGTTTVTQTDDFVLYAHWIGDSFPSGDIVPEQGLLPQTGDVSSVLLPLLFLPAAVVFFTGYVVLKRNER